jgi:hypothetical protein
VKKVGMGQRTAMFPCQLPFCHCPASIKGWNSRPKLETKFEGTCALLHSYSYTVHKHCVHGTAVPWLRQFLTGLSPQRPRFNSRPVHVWDLWWTKWHSVRFLSKYVGFPIVNARVLHSFIYPSPIAHNASYMAAKLDNTLTKLLGRVMLYIKNSMLEVPLID